MGLVLSDSKGNFAPVPSGMHQAVCYGIVDLGIQPPPANSNFPARRKGAFLFELPYERMDIDKNGETVNVARQLSKTMTLSLNPKGKLRGALKSWRGRDFTPEELKSFELKNLLGANCTLNVIQLPGMGINASKTYANIENILPPTKGSAKCKAESNPVFFSFDDVTTEGVVQFPVGTPDWVIKKAMESEEYKNITNVASHAPGATSTSVLTEAQKKMVNAAHAAVQAAGLAPDSPKEDTEDVPF